MRGTVTKNKKDSAGKRLGVKKFGGEEVFANDTLIRQRGFKWKAGENVIVGRDHTLVAAKEGVVKMTTDPYTNRRVVRVHVVEQEIPNRLISLPLPFMYHPELNPELAKRNIQAEPLDISSIKFQKEFNKEELTKDKLRKKEEAEERIINSTKGVLRREDSVKIFNRTSNIKDLSKKKATKICSLVGSRIGSTVVDDFKSYLLPMKLLEEINPIKKNKMIEAEAETLAEDDSRSLVLNKQRNLLSELPYELMQSDILTKKQMIEGSLFGKGEQEASTSTDQDNYSFYSEVRDFDYMNLYYNHFENIFKFMSNKSLKKIIAYPKKFDTVKATNEARIIRRKLSNAAWTEENYSEFLQGLHQLRSFKSITDKDLPFLYIICKYGFLFESDFSKGKDILVKEVKSFNVLIRKLRTNIAKKEFRVKRINLRLTAFAKLKVRFSKNKRRSQRRKNAKVNKSLLQQAKAE